MKKMLVAVDDSKGAMKAVEYVGRHFGGEGDLQITLVHVLPNLPAIFWDEGHILTDAEKKDRKKVVDLWLAKQKKKIDPVLKKAMKSLTQKGIDPDGILTTFVSDSTDTSESLLEAAKDGGYQTIVLGRRGASAGKRPHLGGVTGKVAALASGLAVTIVA